MNTDYIRIIEDTKEAKEAYDEEMGNYNFIGVVYITREHLAALLEGKVIAFPGLQEDTSLFLKIKEPYVKKGKGIVIIKGDK